MPTATIEKSSLLLVVMMTRKMCATVKNKDCKEETKVQTRNNNRDC